jgi:hypothetical protein
VDPDLGEDTESAFDIRDAFTTGTGTDNAGGTAR